MFSKQAGSPDAKTVLLRVRGCILTGFITFVLIALAFSPAAVAQLASRPADQWIKTLESPHRVAGLKIDETIAHLAVKPGDVVADIGAGSGLYTVPLAKAVSPGGTVYAVEIEQGLLDHIAGRAKELQLTNIQTVLGKYTDPNLPEAGVDLAFIGDVLHHIEDRPAYLAALARYMKPEGLIAIVDFHPAQGPHKDDPALQVTQEQASKWLASAGFKPAPDLKLFEDRWFVIYSR